MPIMDGFTACQKIHQHLKMVKDQLVFSSKQEVLIQDTQRNDFHIQFNKLVMLMTKATTAVSAKCTLAPTRLKEFADQYQRLKLQSLDQRNIPFIIANSALINTEIEARTKKCGFVKCIQTPVNAEIFMAEVMPLVDRVGQAFF